LIMVFLIASDFFYRNRVRITRKVED